MSLQLCYKDTDAIDECPFHSLTYGTFKTACQLFKRLPLLRILPQRMVESMSKGTWLSQGTPRVTWRLADCAPGQSSLAHSAFRKTHMFNTALQLYSFAGTHSTPAFLSTVQEGPR